MAESLIGTLWPTEDLAHLPEPDPGNDRHDDGQIRASLRVSPYELLRLR